MAELRAEIGGAEHAAPLDLGHDHGCGGARRRGFEAAAVVRTLDRLGHVFRDARGSRPGAPPSTPTRIDITEAAEPPFGALFHL